MNGPLQIALATPADARAVAQIHVSAWQAAYASLLPADFLAALSVDDREAMWRECIATGTPELLVARHDATVCGWLASGASRDDDADAADAEVWALYVAPASWSSGVARGLWQAARARLAAHGFGRCSLWVFAHNERAIRFYRAVGFMPDPSPPKAFVLGGRTLHEVRHVCQLDAS